MSLIERGLPEGQSRQPRRRLKEVAKDAWIDANVRYALWVFKSPHPEKRHNTAKTVVRRTLKTTAAIAVAAGLVELIFIGADGGGNPVDVPLPIQPPPMP